MSIEKISFLSYNIIQKNLYVVNNLSGSFRDNSIIYMIGMLIF